MPIKDLAQLQSTLPTNKEIKKYYVFGKLIKELQKKEIKEPVVNVINDNINLVNHAIENQFTLSKQIRISQNILIKLLEKECQLVPKNHYRTQWLAIGMAAFGLPIGVALSLSIFNNMALMGLGLPIGMVVGMVYGDSLDKKAAQEGRQLDVELSSF